MYQPNRRSDQTGAGAYLSSYSPSALSSGVKQARLEADHSYLVTTFRRQKVKNEWKHAYTPLLIFPHGVHRNKFTSNFIQAWKQQTHRRVVSVPYEFVSYVQT